MVTLVATGTNTNRREAVTKQSIIEFIHRGEAELCNILTCQLLDTFTKTTTAVKKRFENVKLRQVPATGSHTQKVMSIVSFQIAPFC